MIPSIIKTMKHPKTSWEPIENTCQQEEILAKITNTHSYTEKPYIHTYIHTYASPTYTCNVKENTETDNFIYFSNARDVLKISNKHSYRYRAQHHIKNKSARIAEHKYKLF